MDAQERRNAAGESVESEPDSHLNTPFEAEEEICGAGLPSLIEGGGLLDAVAKKKKKKNVSEQLGIEEGQVGLHCPLLPFQARFTFGTPSHELGASGLSERGNGRSNAVQRVFKRARSCPIRRARVHDVRARITLVETRVGVTTSAAVGRPTDRAVKLLVPMCTVVQAREEASDQASTTEGVSAGVWNERDRVRENFVATMKMMSDEFSGTEKRRREETHRAHV
jgi:hypothetical protein